MRGRFGQISRLSVLGCVAGLAALGLSAGTAHAAATIDVTPSTVAPGATITVTGHGFAVGVVIEIDIRNGNDVRPASTQQLPDFTFTAAAPSDLGSWQVCASGGPDFVCDTFTVATPTTTAANTPPTAAPTFTTAAPDTTAVVSTAVVSTAVVSTAPDGATTTLALLVPPPSTAEVTLPPTTPPPTLPPGADGSATLDEPPSTVDGDGFSGLAIGGAIGIVALAGLGVAGLWSSSSFGGPRPKPAIGVGVAGALLAGATLFGAPPPKANVPKLAITRIQVSQTLDRGAAASTITADCPTGSSAIGGGFTSDWSSWRLDDLQPMIDWMENPNEGNATLSPANAASASDSSQPAADYFLFARLDGSVHYSDQIHRSAYNSWLSIEESRRSVDANREDPATPVLDPSTIPWSPSKAIAESHLYYRAVDTLLRGANPKLRTVGLLVSESAPTERAWRVTAALAGNSLQSSVTVRVVALCAPISGKNSPDGVPGVALRSQSAAAAVDLTALCETDEVLTSIGWNNGRSGGITTAIATAAGTAAYRPSGSGGTETVVATCVRGPGVAGTTASATTTVSGGFEGGTTASCPSGYTATGGGLDLLLKTYRHDTERAAQSVVAAAPTGTKTYGAQIRGVLRWPPETPAPGSALFSARNGERFIPLTAYANSDSTAMTVQAICLKRVLS